MPEGYDLLRVAIFTILFASWLIMLYKGVLRMVLHRNSFMWDKFMNLLWVSCVMYGLAEILVSNLPGGPRLWVSFTVSLVQLWVVLFQYDKIVYPVDRVLKPRKNA